MTNAEAIRRIALFRGAVTHMLKPGAASRPLLGDWRTVHDYLRVTMAFERSERLRGLFLDARNRLVCDAILGSGTVDRVSVQPREVVARALDIGAVAIILAHNHPSGDPAPSKADRVFTRRLADACTLLDIRLIDHIIVGSSGSYSFQGEGLL